MKVSALVAAVVAPLAVFAQSSTLKIINPSSTLWWIANSEAELKWEGDAPNFTAFIYNSNPQLLAAGSAQLQGIGQTYNRGVNFNLFPGINPGTGYTVKMVDPVNSSIVFATSESFEVKPQGSNYPPTDTPTSPIPSATASASGSAAAASNAPTASASSSPKSGAASLSVNVASVAIAGTLVYALA